MSQLGWQDLLVAVAAIAATIYLVRKRRAKAPPSQPPVKLGRAPKRNV